ncbi:MAG: flagellar motor protein MotB [Pseudomonadota bacterium]
MAGEKKKDDAKRPIIKKVKKVSGGGHHGGAWKVAYADFVTAMMAFFLLLWLLSSSSKATLQGLSEYFTPTQGIKDSQGIGFDGGATANKDGKGKGGSAPAVIAGSPPSGSTPDSVDTPSKSDANMDDNLFKKGASSIEQAFSQDAAMKQYQENIAVSQSPEGLKIDITDSDKHAMFEKGTSTLTDAGRAILTKITSLIKKMPNYISITGHTDASQLEAGQANYTNWELSSDRAQSARRFLLKAGVEMERPKKVVGMADRELYTPQEPRGPRNRRITIIMLRGSHILIPDAALSSPKESAPAVEAPVTAPAAAAAPAAAHH